MVVFKKVIPSLAAAALSLTGCGDSTDGTGGEALANSIRSFCMKIVECYPEDYTLQECVNYYTAYVNDYLAAPGCESALISYFDCFSALSCQEVDDPDACDAQFQAVNAACEIAP